MNRVPPHNLEAEQSVLGAIILSNQAIYQTGLTDNDFYKSAHQKIYRAMESLSDNGDPVDLIALSQYFIENGGAEQVGGLVYLSSLTDSVPTAANIGYYAKIVRSMSTRRRIISVATEMAQKAYDIDGMSIDGLMGDIEEKVFSIGNNNGRKESVSFGAALKKTLNGIELLFDNPEKVAGVSTGLVDLDDVTGGLIKTDLIVAAARPGIGKSALATTISDNICKAGGCVLVFSLEMSCDQLCKRHLSAAAQVDGKKFRSGNLTAVDFSSIVGSAGDMGDYNLFINDDPDVSLRDMRSEIIRVTSRQKIDLVVVDYMQLVTPVGVSNSRNREQEIAEISRGLKKIAKKFDVPVLALTQLNRGCEMRQDKRPILSDLRDSGAIEMDADVVIMIYRDVVYNDKTDNPTKAELIIRKQRNGPCRTVYTRFIDEFAVFRNYTEG